MRKPAMMAALGHYLAPGAAEQDEGFREEIFNQSHHGLRMIAALTAGGALLLMAGWWLLYPHGKSTAARLWADLLIISLGGLGLGLSKWTAIYERTRLAALLLLQLTAACLIGASLYLSSVEPAAEDFVASQMTLTVLIAVVALPLRPVQTLLHCAGIMAVYGAAVAVAAQTFLPGATARPEYFLFMAVMASLAVVLSATMYAERRNLYFGQMKTLQAVGDLRRTQQQLVRSESAASMARLAAAISHELNTPVGALKSSVDTLLLLASRQATAPPEQMPRLVKLQADLRRSIQESATRLQEIAARVARFTNLDQAEVQQIGLAEALGDVLDLLRSKVPAGVEMRREFSDVPRLVGNPQQISAVFYDLVHNSLRAVGDAGRVTLRLRIRSGAVEVEIEDTGRGIARDKLAHIFEPGFEESAGRMSTGNWSMFTARQVIREHGGEIMIESEAGAWTRVIVQLPVGPASGRINSGA
ncbi:MAG: HAMP domain-containing sensor histidine kinase [Acidobacteria bacterium]|nr:HAMP domain-containing sensor histidine kinase [Acidobacteriota bacterium]